MNSISKIDKQINKTLCVPFQEHSYNYLYIHKLDRIKNIMTMTYMFTYVCVCVL